ncbi:DUF6000 family protein [Nocardia sp. CC201C]|uniref:DUF6000 family protein n=1 Tax=Nocardia sp. CC201C TaxID=3044575 RepID=UPI0024A7FB3A|nr:DUF6000 family protein [Nocardia sp. CC201C]
MSFRLPADQPSLALIRRWVIGDCAPPGRYMRLRGANLLRDHPDRREFEASLSRDAREITDDELRTLLEFDWRPRLTASWLIGLDKRTDFRAELAELLLADELVHAGWGYCLALARFGTPADVDVLVTYLTRPAGPAKSGYSRVPALGALCALDRTLGTAHATRFLNAAAQSAQPPSGGSRQSPVDSGVITRLCALSDRIMTRTS